MTTELWKSKASLFTRLPVRVQRILATPAMSADSQRNFSRAVNIGATRKVRTAPKMWTRYS